MDVYNGLNPASGTFTPVSISDYKERFSYNPDGGILTLLRNGAGSTVIDNAAWNYYAGTHRLEHINDPAGRYGFDAGNQAANNYSYDAIGEMTADVERGLTATWNVYGKPSSQTIGGTTINFTYDASGNRTSKTLSNGYKEFYVRDAGGNVMSIYRSGDASLNSGDLSQAEINVYGSNRLGSTRPNTDVQTIVSNTIALSGGFGNAVVSTFTRGSKLFELSDHRSNDMVTITDRRQQVSADNTTVNYYVADIAAAQDYSSFGSLLQGRQFGGTPRYTYNGKQLDTETGWQDYGMRAYLVDVPIFGSVDPISKSYPELTPYQFASNRPIQGIDLDGKEVLLVTGSGNGFMLFAGAEIGAGIAVGKEGVAFVAFQDYRLGFGFELGASVNFTLYPSMQKLEDLGGLSFGGSISAAYAYRVGGGVSKSSGHWGGTISPIGAGAGGHISGDASISGLKIFKWADIVALVVKQTNESKELQTFFGINDKNRSNTIQIVKDYFKKMSTEIKDKRISDLNEKNKKNQEIVKNSKDFIDDYNKSGFIYKALNFFEKKKVEVEKGNAEKDLKNNKEEIQQLQKMEIKF